MDKQKNAVGKIDKQMAVQEDTVDAVAQLGNNDSEEGKIIASKKREGGKYMCSN
jgi:hypothetical protein